MFPALRPVPSNKVVDVNHLLRAQHQQSRSHQRERANQEGDDTSGLPSPDRQKQGTSSGSKGRKTIVIASSKNKVTCPECGEEFDVVEEVGTFKAHVFKCRLDKGTDPLLPLHLLKQPHSTSGRRPGKPRSNSTTAGGGGSRLGDVADQLLRPIRPAFERIELFAGYESPRQPDQGSPRVSQSARGTRDSRSATAGKTLNHFASATSNAPIAVTRSTRSSRGWRQTVVDGDGNISPRKHSPRGASSRNRSNKPTKGDADEAAKQEEERPDPDDPTQLCQTIQSYNDDLDLGQSDYTLNLASHEIGSRHIPILSIALGHGSTLEVQTLDLQGTYVHPTVMAPLVALLRDNSTITEIFLEGTSLYPRHCQALRDVAHRNDRHAKSREAEKEFKSMVQNYKTSEEEARTANKTFFADVRTTRRADTEEEKKERQDLFQRFKAALGRQEGLVRRQQLKALKGEQRKSLILAESEHRGRWEQRYFAAWLNITIKCETDDRHIITSEKDSARLHDRMVEREALIEVRAAVSARRQAERQARLDVEEEQDDARCELMNEHESCVEVYFKQFQRHRSFVTWKQQQREDLEGRARYEQIVREGLEKEEDMCRNSLIEKLRRTLESMKIKYAAQQEMVEELQRHRREVNENAMLGWWSTGLKLFNTEARLIRLFNRSVERNAERVRLLNVMPEIFVTHNNDDLPPLYCMPALGQTPSAGVPLLQDIDMTVRMPSGWLDECQASQDLCKTGLQEEKTMMHDHLRWCNRNVRVRARCVEVIHADIVEVDLGNVLQVTKKSDITTWLDLEQKDVMSDGSSGGTTSTTPQLIPLKPGDRPTSGSGTARGKTPAGAAPSKTPAGAAPSKTPAGAAPSSRSGKREPVIAQAPPPSAGSDPLVLAERANANRWAQAWLDRRTPKQILQEKLAIRGGVAELKIVPVEAPQEAETTESDAPAPPPSLPLGAQGDRLSVEEPTDLPLLYDDGETKPEGESTGKESQATLNASLVLSGSSRAPPPAAAPSRPTFVATYHASFEGVTFVGSKTGGEGERQTPIPDEDENSRTMTADELPLAKSVGTTGSSGDDDDEAGEEEEEEDEEEPETLYAGKVLAFDLGAPHMEHEADFGDLATQIKKILYSNGDIVTKLTNLDPRLCKVEMALSLCFAQQASYHGEYLHTGSDFAGWEPLNIEESPTLLRTDLNRHFAVGVVPSAFELAEPFPESVVMIEGQINDQPMFPPLVAKIHEPHRIFWQADPADPSHRKLTMERVELSPGLLRTPGMAETTYAGGTLSVEILHPATAMDRISIRDEAPAVKCETSTTNTFVQSIAVHGKMLLSIQSGEVQAARMVSIKNGPATRGQCAMNIIGDGQLVSGEALRQVIQRLRYHNFSVEPEPGDRIAQVTLTSGDGKFTTQVQMKYEIQPIDKPTELRIVHPKLIYRLPYNTAPAALKEHLLPALVPVAPDCLVVDEDTDRFSGGNMKVVLDVPVKGDILVFCPRSHLLYPTMEVLEKPAPLSVGGDGRSIIFEERVVAVLTSGQVFTSHDGEETATQDPLLQTQSTLLTTTTDDAATTEPTLPLDGTGTMDGASFEANGTPALESSETLITMDFAQDDDCSVSAVQAILRHIAIKPLGGQPLKAHLASTRHVDIQIQIMDNEQACYPAGEVTIKAGGHAVQLPDKGATVEYKEGTGIIKMPNFDVSNDRINPINNFATGYLAVSVAEGFEADSISLKVDESEFKLVDVGEKPSKIARMVSRTFGPDAKNLSETQPPPPLAAPSKSARNMGGLNRLKSAAMDVVAKSTAAKLGSGDLTSQSSLAATDSLGSKFASAAKEMLNKSLEVVFAGMREPMAQVTRMGSGKGLFIKFYKDKKENAVTKKHVLALMRNLTYAHVSNAPSETKKVIRLWLTDSASTTPTQALVAVNIEIVDDVTEILLKSPKKRYIQAPEAPSFPLFPAGRSKFVDDDTDFFDGGQLTITTVAGATRGDVFGIKPLPLQKGPQKPPVAGMTVPVPPTLTVSGDGHTLFQDGDEAPLATVETSTQNGGHSEMRIKFASIPGPDGKPLKRLAIDTASTILNSVCYGNVLEKVKDPNRSFLVKIRDRENPQEGKCKLQVEILAPLFVLSPCVPFGTSTTFDHQFVHDHYLVQGSGEGPVIPADAAPICKTLVVNMDKFQLGGGFLQVVLSNLEEPDYVDTIEFRPKDVQGASVSKDGTQLMQGKDNVASLALQPDRVKIEWPQGTKLNKGTLQNVLRAIFIVPCPTRHVSRETAGGATPGQATPGSGSNAPSVSDGERTAAHVHWTLNDGQFNETKLTTNIVY